MFQCISTSQCVQKSSILICLPDIFNVVSYIAYEKLWAAVTGGRGAGRGKKKVVTKGVDPELLKYGKSQDYPEKINDSDAACTQQHCPQMMS